jgi:hypothetical protein
MKAYYPKGLNEAKFNIYKTGVIVDLDIHQWGARTKLRPEDLGLDSVPELIKLGHKELMKPEYLKKIRSILIKTERWVLDPAHTYAFPFGNARFVPAALIEDMVKFFTDAEKELKDVLEEFLEKDYDNMKAKMLTEYREVFTKMLAESGKGNLDPEREIDKLISRIEAKYPSKNDLRNRFGIDFTMFEISLPEFKETDGAGAMEKVYLNMEYHKKASEKIDGFLDTVIMTLKNRVLEITEHMKGRLAQGNLNQMQIKSFVKFANEFKKQDFIGTDLDKTLDAFKEKLSNADKEDLSNEEFNNKLKADLDVIENEVVNSDKSKILDRYLRRIEVGE